MRQDRFLEKLTGIERELAQAGFFQPENPSTEDALRKIEGELEREGFFTRKPAPKTRSIRWFALRRHWFTVAAAVAAILVVARVFLDPAPAPIPAPVLYALAVQFQDQASQPKLMPSGQGFAGSDNIDSLLAARNYRAALDSIRARNSPGKSSAYWEAVCLLQLSAQPGDPMVLEAIRLLEPLGEFVADGEHFVQCQLVLAYLKNNQIGAANDVLNKLRNSPDEDARSFAQAIQQQLRQL